MKVEAVETFTEPRGFIANPRYSQDHHDALAALDLSSIDGPIVDIVAGFATLPHCFTLQSCYGHFVWSPGQNPHTLEPTPDGFSGSLRYRIAYIAFCIENSQRGRALREALAQIPRVAPGYIQFGSADWFWERWANSYALQVEPVVHQLQDEAILGSAEAIRTQAARDAFFRELRAVLAAQRREHELMERPR
jgi:hypothetical protein